MFVVSIFFPVKPFFNKEPADITVLAGKNVQFYCSVGGGKFDILEYIANIVFITLRASL